MTYSKLHQRLSRHLGTLDVFTNPEKYLGPNWQDVLNFWIYFDTLSVQERKEISQRYWSLFWDLRPKARYSVRGVARVVAVEVVGAKNRHAISCAVRVVTGWNVFSCSTYELHVFSCVTDELIGHHRLLEQNKTPLALQCFVKSIT